LVRFLLGFIVFLGMASTASASVGVNVSPGWGDTVDGRDIQKMERVLTDFRPDSARLPWVDNAGTREALRFNASQGIDSIVIDNARWSPEQVVREIAATGLPVAAVEGVNEPDLSDTGYTWTEVPIPLAKLAEVRDRQQRLYNAVAGRWPVLCPAAVHNVNEAAMASLACDIVSIHRYQPCPECHPPTPDQATLPSFDKPIWVTETGISTYKKGLSYSRWAVTWEMQADYLPKFIEMLRGNGAQRVVVYSLQDTSQNIRESGGNFGLYTWGGAPKPAAHALRGD
jgi:hypothetical protein